MTAGQGRPLQRRMQIAACVLLSLALLQGAAQAVALAQGVESAATALTIDDTYYYLQTAWNTRQFGFPTFDGLHPTNGVQLLWFWILVAICWFVPTKTAFLFAALAACLVLNTLCYLVVYKLGRLLRRPTLTLGLASLWTALTLSTGGYSTGMENSLHAFVLWCVVWQATTFIVRVQRRERPNLLLLTALLVLNAWARIDAGLYSAILYVYCLTLALRSRTFSLSERRDVVLVAGSGLLAAGGLAAQLFAFRLMGGSWLPVSALIKSTWATWNADAVRDLAGLAIGAILPLAGLLLARRHVQESEESAAFRRTWCCLLVGVLLHLVPTVGVKAHAMYFWYLAPWHIYAIISVSLVADTAESLVSPAIIRTVLALAGALLTAASCLPFAVRIAYPTPLYVARYRAGSWMADNLPMDAVCVSWNAGEIGYFSERTVINLDGLINSADYYQRVLRGPVTVQEYIRENGATCAADYNLEARLSLPFAVLQEFPVGDRNVKVQVWDISPHAARP